MTDKKKAPKKAPMQNTDYSMPVQLIDIDLTVGKILQHCLPDYDLLANSIFNAHSVYGVDLSILMKDRKRVVTSDADKYSSLKMYETIILYDVEAVKDDDVNFTEEAKASDEYLDQVYDINQSYIDPNDIHVARTGYKFEVSVIIYGSSSDQLAALLKARLESAEARQTIEDDYATHLAEVSSISSSTEFMNEMLWQRADLSFIAEAEVEMPLYGATSLEKLTYLSTATSKSEIGNDIKEEPKDISGGEE